MRKFPKEQIYDIVCPISGKIIGKTNIPPEHQRGDIVDSEAFEEQELEKALKKVKNFTCRYLSKKKINKIKKKYA